MVKTVLLPYPTSETERFEPFFSVAHMLLLPPRELISSARLTDIVCPTLGSPLVSLLKVCNLAKQLDFYFGLLEELSAVLDHLYGHLLVGLPVVRLDNLVGGGM